MVKEGRMIIFSPQNTKGVSQDQGTEVNSQTI